MTKKISNFVRYFALSLVLMMSLFLTSVFPSEASDVTFNLGSDDVPSGGSGVYANGISASHKSGYLVYIVDQYGNRASPDAKLYLSTSSCSLPTGSSVRWRVESRLGGYSVSKSDYNPSNVAPWNISPLRIDGGWFSNESEIRSWMAMPSVGRPELLNVQQFIIDAWSLDLEERWVSEDLAGMLTVDPSTFPYVDISSTDASGYSSYLSAIRSGIEPSIDRCYDGRVSGTYDEGTMDCSPVIGGA